MVFREFAGRREMGGERSSSKGTWAVEFDGPSLFFTSRLPRGGTLLKRLHRELSDCNWCCWATSSSSCPTGSGKGARGQVSERVQYLRGKLARVPPSELASASTSAVPNRNDHDLVHGRGSITVKSLLKNAQFFKTKAQYMLEVHQHVVYVRSNGTQKALRMSDQRGKQMRLVNAQGVPDRELEPCSGSALSVSRW